MNKGYYAYKGDAELGSEPCGTEGRHVWEDLKTTKGAVRRMQGLYGNKSFKIYSFTDFYDNKTFKLIYKQG